MFDSGDLLRRNYMLVTVRVNKLTVVFSEALKYKKKSEFFFFLAKSTPFLYFISLD